MTLIESADAARILHVTPARVRQLALVGRLPVAVTTPRGARLFTRDAVEALARERAERLRELASELD